MLSEGYIEAHLFLYQLPQYSLITVSEVPPVNWKLPMYNLQSKNPVNKNIHIVHSENLEHCLSDSLVICEVIFTFYPAEGSGGEFLSNSFKETATSHEREQKPPYTLYSKFKRLPFKNSIQISCPTVLQSAAAEAPQVYSIEFKSMGVNSQPPQGVRLRRKCHSQF